MKLPIVYTYSMLRKNASGPNKSAFRAGFGPDCYRESALRPAEGRQEGRFRSFPDSSPAKIQPGRPISGPEALSRSSATMRATVPFCWRPTEWTWLAR